MTKGMKCKGHFSKGPVAMQNQRFGGRANMTTVRSLSPILELRCTPQRVRARGTIERCTVLTISKSVPSSGPSGAAWKRTTALPHSLGDTGG